MRRDPSVLATSVWTTLQGIQFQYSEAPLQYLIISINLFISKGSSGTYFASVSIVLFLPNITHEVARI